jgi:hypothetical protein
VGSFAFAGCAKLQHIQIPDSIYEIDEYSFSRCTDLSKVVVGSGLRVLEESIFHECSNLRSLEFNGTKHEWRSIKKHRNWRKGSILECIHCLDGDVQLR